MIYGLRYIIQLLLIPRIGSLVTIFVLLTKIILWNLISGLDRFVSDELCGTHYSFGFFKARV